jgi:hypothetical protein
MMDTAANVIGKENVEHAKELVQDVLSDITDKVKDTELVQHLRPAKKAKRKTGRLLLIVLVLVGAGALVAYAMRRQGRMPDERDVAPDPFGQALEEERAAMRLGSDVATPGA